MPTYRLDEIAKLVGGEVIGDPATPIWGVSSIKDAAEGDITFVGRGEYVPFLKTTRASAVIVSEPDGCPLPMIRADNPYLAFLKAIELFAREVALEHEPGIDPSAVVHPDACVAASAHVGPLVVLERGVDVGEGTAILAGAKIGQDSRIGRECLIYPNVVIRERTTIGDRVIIHPGAVLGSDGFGFVWDGEVHRKVPQIGSVVVEDDVEIGANATIDRATVGETRIGRGTKIDNLVQIGHNVKIGEASILVSQVGISGSTEVGRRVTIAGQAGLVGHLTIGDGVTIGAQAGVTKSIQEGTQVLGAPARPVADFRRMDAVFARLPELRKTIRSLEKRVEALEGRKR